MKTIALMRPQSSMEESARKAEGMGFRVVSAPMLELEPVGDSGLEGLVEEISEEKVDYVIFTSANGVSFALQQAQDTVGADRLVGALSNTKVVAIGTKTRQSLERAGVSVSRIPETFSSDGLVKLFSGMPVKGSRVAIVRSTHGSERLVSGLKGLGAEVTDMPVYTLRPPGDTEDVDRLMTLASEGGVDVFCFTSSMMVHNFFEVARSKGVIEQVIRRMGEAKVAAIGEPTVDALRVYGVEAGIVPAVQTFDALMEEVGRLA